MMGQNKPGLEIAQSFFAVQFIQLEIKTRVHAITTLAKGCPHEQ